MKKILFMTVIFTLFLSVSASAITVEPWGNLEDDILRISGSDENASKVTMLVINPGYSEDDAGTDGENAIQIYAKSEVKDGRFIFDIPMFDAGGIGGGEYKYVISNGTSAQRGSFSFYFYQAKTDIIEDINELDDVADLVDKIYATYSLNSSEVFKNTPKATISSFIKKTPNYPVNPDNMKTELIKALCLAAYNEGVSALADDGYLMYEDVLGISGTDLHNDYKTLLSAEGTAEVNSRVIGGDYEVISDISREFENQALLCLITKNKDAGYGHVEDILKKYETQYETAGIKLGKITATGHEFDVYRAMVNSSATSLQELKKDVDAAVKKYSKTESGGVGGGGGSTPDSLPQNDPISSPVSPEEGYIEKADSLFVDIDSVSWANEAIGILYNRGIISGRSETEFAPQEYITRAEFTKLVVAAFFGTPTDKTSSFSDVSGWSVPYVEYAYKNGIVNGITADTFNPSGNISREQAAAILQRTLAGKNYEGKKRETTFSDDESISSWAKESVYKLAGDGVISGRGNNTFCPLDNLTRAEAAKIIYLSAKLVEGDN